MRHASPSQPFGSPCRSFTRSRAPRKSAGRPGTYSAFPDAGPHVYNDVEFDGRRNGARGPGFMQLDMRIGYRARLGGARTLDVFGDIFNVTDHVNFTNPSGNRRVTANFLRLSGLFGASGFPRQVQFGARLGF